MAEYQGRKVTLNKPFRLSTAESKRKSLVFTSKTNLLGE